MLASHDFVIHISQHQMDNSTFKNDLRCMKTMSKVVFNLNLQQLQVFFIPSKTPVSLQLQLTEGHSSQSSAAFLRLH